ncbi:MAG: acetoacetate--CoA ligase [Chloroflexi bacterium]|nr:acetoacetate--CoA ligase [Chloroflexota bacterium]
MINRKRPTADRLLWSPSRERMERANMTRFTDFVNQRHGTRFIFYDEMYDWSVENISAFWSAVWDFVDIRASRRYDQVVDDLTRFPGASWFKGARLNFAENLLRYRDGHAALVFRGEDRKIARITYAELYDMVARLASSLRKMGVKPGDRVAAYMPNLMETAIAMLASTSIGATWASCASDLGVQATIDRLDQIKPKVLFVADGYFYKGKTFSSLANVAEVVAGVPSLQNVVVVRYTGEGAPVAGLRGAAGYDELVAAEPEELKFEQLPPDHPVYIMFSSGTTGKPKCMVQGAAGVLVNHLKELVIHADLKREDRIFYITTCSWMMWNWLLSSLGAGATVVLYDGNPTYPDTGAMWKLVQDEKITIFGTSASYLNFLRSEALRPGSQYDLSSLREICQTGSALSAEGFEYVYENVKRDVHFNSIAGGTDINGCFAIGSPTVPVYAGQAQKRGLGMKVKCYDDKGNPIYDQVGELVCEAPAPSMPLFFHSDPGGQKYHDAYFSVYPGVWRHGDYAMVHSDTRGITFFGRSDAVLKPSGVRIGTAEIYRQVEKLEEIADSLAVGQEWQGDQRVLLFVKLSTGSSLSDELRNKIRRVLREQASPRHVPAKIIAVPEIPYTLNMKKVEIAVANIVNHRPVLNRDVLANPSSLDHYEKLLTELEKD